MPVVEQQAPIVFHTEDASLKLTLLVPEAIIAVAVVKVHKIEFGDVSIGSLTGQFLVFLERDDEFLQQLLAIYVVAHNLFE